MLSDPRESELAVRTMLISRTKWNAVREMLISRTGITEVMGSIPVQAWIFSGFFFSTA